MLVPMHNPNHRRCSACGELSITARQRFIGGWFYIRCPNCRRLLRVDPQHGQRWVLLAAFAVVGAASIALVFLTENPMVSITIGWTGCALLYVWEFLLTRRAPLEAVTEEEAREYRRHWVITASAMVFATAAVAFAATQI
jgi:hypothetical protein